MSARKKCRTEVSSNSGLCLGPTETKLLYRLVTGKEELLDRCISRIYSILPGCGWSFMDRVFMFDSSKENCCIFKDSDIDETHGNFVDAALGADLQVFAPNTNLPEDYLRFVINVQVNDDIRGENIFDTMNLGPLLLSLEVKARSGTKCKMELEFCPGVLFAFSPEASDSWINDQCIVYHGFVDDKNTEWCSELGEFLRSTEGDNLPIVKVKRVRELAEIQEPFQLAPMTMPTPFTLIDKENKRHQCHKEVLMDQSPYFLKFLEENPNQLEMEILEAGPETVDLLIHHLYYPQKPLPSISNFEVAVELMILAFQSKTFNLLATVVNTIIEKVDEAAPSLLLDAFAFIYELKFKLQIFKTLWKALLVEIRIRILDENNLVNYRLDSDASFLSFKAFVKDGSVRFKILEQLCKDLTHTSGGGNIDVTQHLQIQIAINRFQGEVIKRMQTGCDVLLKMNHTKLFLNQN